MFTSRHKRAGFTLIELLVVIAIIMILAGLTAAVLPGVLKRAKMARLKSTFMDLRTALAQYYTDHDTYPPAYGYLVRMRNPADPSQFIVVQNHKPFMVYLERHEDFEVYENFTDGGADTERNNDISRFEYSPVGNLSVTDPSATYVMGFTTDIFQDLSNWNSEALSVRQELDAMDDRSARPLIYVPIYSRYHRRVAQYWINNDDAGGDNPRPNDLAAGDTGNVELQQLVFPPPRYDSYILMSIGPDGTTAGMVYAGNTAEFNLGDYVTAGPNGDLSYHFLGHAIYFMATRDADGNKQLDFDYEARTTRGEAQFEGNNLPDPLRPRGGGPMIFVTK